MRCAVRAPARRPTLRGHKYSPWKSREELINLQTKKIPDSDIEELTNFLYDNKDLQVMFIFKRLEASLEKMMAVSSNKENEIGRAHV